MAHHNQVLKAFRWAGGINFKSNTHKIWFVLGFLSVVTGIEVALGILKPEYMISTYLGGMKLLNWVFIILTLVKAYYITWDFMHMRDEKSFLRRAVVWTPIFLVAYLIMILLFEATYIEEIMSSLFYKWKF